MSILSHYPHLVPCTICFCFFSPLGGGDNRALTITLAVVLPILFILVTSALIATILFVSFYIRQKHKYKVCSFVYMYMYIKIIDFEVESVCEHFYSDCVIISLCILVYSLVWIDVVYHVFSSSIEEALCYD